MCGPFFSLITDGRAQSTVGSSTFGKVILDYITNDSE